VVSSDERAQVALDAGAHHAILREGVPDKVRALTGDRGVDLVVDVVGGDIRNALRCLAPLGRVLAVGFASGEIPTVKVNRLLLTNTDVRGVESDYLWTAGISRAAWDDLMTLHRDGYIKAVIQETGSFDDYGPALTKLDERRVVGRIVLSA
jgi:NADPH2:quinone reductase